ncbi:MAG: diaminobutyrate-2-oxoglutarate aminotransferase [Porticoccaceae bacterium]|jgi:hypothetical protein|nr:diaminobutyrate-2-oxoglutarate aminotransferase [Porticoccaceae bacterium]MBT4164305.1 diaminobutyrate-2-oxoglutarate aminotransferase [Porticoccaceae bacterium]MBT4210642.1 diaminobutyrate-2-oxoglutarate aminotransferase [Porticoccaceae bacterium]MBT4592165.1 diaminobutyrate-2-oxoglutarate aminotransferase [Porticoccaceae bacterium]MBT5003568.1 diaminobutyrate-2-oxoglutarate aminotransferase [Porticoccaceae bacterium]
MGRLIIERRLNTYFSRWSQAARLLTSSNKNLNWYFIVACEKLQLITTLFSAEFELSFNTILIGGADEPLYLPATQESRICRIFYRQDFISSALHEIAHWCLAGNQRRLLEDFGYWYHPDGRNVNEQAIFEAAETKPQALEWMFAVACGHGFRVSADNLEGLDDDGPSYLFRQGIVNQAKSWCISEELPPRAAIFLERLNEAFGNSNVRCDQNYQMAKIA